MTARGASAQQGIALVMTMLVMLLGLGLTAAVIPLTTTETAVVAHHRRAVQLLYSAEAALDLAVTELERSGVWERVAYGGTTLRGWSPTRQLRLSDGMVLDLSDVRVASRSSSPSAVWEFAGQARLDHIVPAFAAIGPQPIAVWLAADQSETPAHDPSDASTRRLVFAASFGPGPAWRAVVAVVRRRASGRIQVSSWQVAR